MFYIILKKTAIFQKKCLHYCRFSVIIIFANVIANVQSNQKEVHTMAKCDICSKEIAFGIKVSHSHRRSNRTWKPNVKKVKAIIDGSPRRVNVCTRCLRSGKVTRAI